MMISMVCPRVSSRKIGPCCLGLAESWFPGRKVMAHLLRAFDRLCRCREWRIVKSHCQFNQQKLYGCYFPEKSLGGNATFYAMWFCVSEPGFAGILRAISFDLAALLSRISWFWCIQQGLEFMKRRCTKSTQWTTRETELLRRKFERLKKQWKPM